MQPKILITGAAGYIGGSLLTDLLTDQSRLVKKDNLYASVRSEEQAAALADLGINVLQLDLTKEKVVVESLSSKKINIVIHTASSIDPTLAKNLITALSKARELSGEDTYFIHTSGLSAFYENTGWPHDPMKDSGPVFETEKQLADSFPLRKTDVAVIEEAKSQGVTSFVVVPSTVYGKGTGQWNQLSVVIPVYIKASISQKMVYKFADDVKVSGVHISDMTALYAQIIEKIVQGKTIPNGTEGYYFALAHDLTWWELVDKLAAALHTRGLVTSPKPQVWSSDEAAANALGVPTAYVQALWNSGENVLAENAHKIGWKPAWDKDRFFQSIDNEVQTVVELGEAKSSLMDSLRKSAKTS